MSIRLLSELEPTLTLKSRRLFTGWAGHSRSPLSPFPSVSGATGRPVAGGGPAWRGHVWGPQGTSCGVSAVTWPHLCPPRHPCPQTLGGSGPHLAIEPRPARRNLCLGEPGGAATAPATPGGGVDDLPSAVPTTQFTLKWGAFPGCRALPLDSLLPREARCRSVSAACPAGTRAEEGGQPLSLGSGVPRRWRQGCPMRTQPHVSGCLSYGLGMDGVMGGCLRTRVHRTPAACQLPMNGYQGQGHKMG